MSPNFDFDALDEAINNAPVAGFGPRSVFGKWTFDLAILSWKGEKGSRKLNTRPFKNGDKADKSKGEYFQITFSCDVPELNPMVTKPWTRKVDIKQSNKSNKDQSKWTLTDWTEIVEPSLKAIFGKDWLKVMAKGIYAEALEATTVEVDYKTGDLRGFDAKEPDPTTGETRHFTNSVPQFVNKFKSKADCIAAYTEKYKKADDDMSFGPDGEIPVKDINDVKGLIGAIEDKDQLIDILTTNTPFNQYDLTALLTAAGADEELLAAAAG